MVAIEAATKEDPCMAFLTRSAAVQASRRKHANTRLVEADLRQPSRTPLTATFDIFLSHASEDAEVIAGVKLLLEGEGVTVYVDWLTDPQTDRRNVTAETADLLRQRMNRSRYLLYASSAVSSASRWMPWELGYFDGRHPGRVSVLPIVENVTDSFRGVEYLGLYPLTERLLLTGIGTRFAQRRTRTSGTAIADLARRP